MTSRRFAALDVLRGASVAAMILVNNPGNWLAVYPPLQHASWNGCTAADLVFPAFIVILGVALPFALGPYLDSSRPLRSVHARIASRTARLILLGLVLNAVVAWPDLAAVRLPGVLQRIGVTYLLAALVVLHVRPRVQLVLAGGVMLLHWLVLAAVPAAGSGSPVWPSPDLALRIDRLAFGAHLLQPTGDPEGVIGTFTSVATALIGAAAGRWIQQEWSRPSRLRSGLAAGGGALLIAGWAWSQVWPMNKALWTGSYAVFAAGLTILVLATTHELLERVGTRILRPLEWLGTNALAVYAGSECVAHLLDRPWVHEGATVLSAKDVLFWTWLAPIVLDGGGVRSSLIYALIYAAVWIAVAALLHERGIVVRA